MPSEPVPATIADGEYLRACFYGMLAAVLAAAPDEELLGKLASLQADGTELGTALGDLAAAACMSDVATVALEYDRLFVGMVRGELVPYASWYLTGFLHEKPLAALRQSMDRLGVAASPDVSEPEDHVASLLETMQGLITGRFGKPLSLAEQKEFSAAHLDPWVRRFLADLEHAGSARFYRAVAAVGRCFLAIEAQAFAMVE